MQDKSFFWQLISCVLPRKKKYKNKKQQKNYPNGLVVENTKRKDSRS